MKRTLTYFELSTTTDNHYYGVLELKSGHTTYIGPFFCRSTARRKALKRLKELREI